MGLLKKKRSDRQEDHEILKKLQTKGVNKAAYSDPELSQGTSEAGHHLRMGRPESARRDHERTVKELKKMPKPNLLAKGGEVCPDCCEGMPCEIHGEQDDSHMFDMIQSVLSKRKQRLSQGGKVANETEPVADFLPNEFDDLVLRDDLDFSYTGKNSGDEVGNSGEDERRKDLVMRAMLKRKKQHNPRPA